MHWIKLDLQFIYFSRLSFPDKSKQLQFKMPTNLVQLKYIAAVSVSILSQVKQSNSFNYSNIDHYSNGVGINSYYNRQASMDSIVLRTISRCTEIRNSKLDNNFEIPSPLVNEEVKNIPDVLVKIVNSTNKYLNTCGELNENPLSNYLRDLALHQNYELLSHTNHLCSMTGDIVTMLSTFS